MKWKTIFFLFLFAAGGLLATVRFYGFDWAVLADLSFYQNLANPSMRIVRVQEGLRKEEIANILTQKLGWDESQKKDFLNAHLAYAKTSLEGRYFPKTYMIEKNSDPVVVSKTMTDEYRKKAATIKKSKKSAIINEETALKVASLIQREAAGKQDMRLISGIIWNRIFKGMKLQVDATLQYAKGTEEKWWPQVESKDKYIDSPYNTYKYQVPPTPIANPGLPAIEAAYNPQATNCLFYLHDKNRNIHCSATYEGHLKNIKQYY